MELLGHRVDAWREDRGTDVRTHGIHMYEKFDENLSGRREVQWVLEMVSRLVVGYGQKTSEMIGPRIPQHRPVRPTPMNSQLLHIFSRFLAYPRNMLMLSTAIPPSRQNSAFALLLEVRT